MLLSDAKPKMVLGLVLSHIDGSYQNRFWRGFFDFCRQHKLGLIVYASRLWRGQAETVKEQEIVYKLADSRKIDALCIDTSAFRNLDDLNAFLANRPTLESIPIIFSSINPVGSISVAPDNYSGIAQVLDHFTEVHACKRFAWVCGPKDIEDAKERNEAVHLYLKEKKLELPKQWDVTADFDISSGKKATDQILNAGIGLPEVIIYANDLMAVGGLEAIQEKSLKVPEDIRIAGFDEDDLALLADPPLATVSQPIEEKARLAANILMDAINGLMPSQPPPLPVTFIPRPSCGCPYSLSPRARAAQQNQLADLSLSHNALVNIAQIIEYLGSVLTLEELVQKLSQLIPILHSGFLFIMLHDNENALELPTEYGIIICAIDGTGRIHIKPDRPTRIFSSLMLPTGLAGHLNQIDGYFVQALNKAGRHFGFVICEITDMHPAVVVSLRDHISEVLYNIIQVRELTEKIKTFELSLDTSIKNETEYRKLFALSPLIALKGSARGHILYANEQAHRLLALPQVENETEPINLFDLFKNLDDLYHRPSATKRDSKNYQLIEATTVCGRRVKLLAKIDIDLQEDTIIINAFDYQNIIKSLILPDETFIKKFDLTRREIEVVGFMLCGLLSKEIASELNVAVSTVKGHISSIFRKLDIGSREQLYTLFSKHLFNWHSPNSIIFTIIAELVKNSGG